MLGEMLGRVLMRSIGGPIPYNTRGDAVGKAAPVDFGWTLKTLGLPASQPSPSPSPRQPLQLTFTAEAESHPLDCAVDVAKCRRSVPSLLRD